MDLYTPQPTIDYKPCEICGKICFNSDLPHGGGKRSTAERYVISACRPAYTTKATRIYCKAKRRSIKPLRFVLRLSRSRRNGRDSRARTYDLLHVKQAL